MCYKNVNDSFNKVATLYNLISKSQPILLSDNLTEFQLIKELVYIISDRPYQLIPYES